MGTRSGAIVGVDPGAVHVGVDVLSPVSNSGNAECKGSIAGARWVVPTTTPPFLRVGMDGVRFVGERATIVGELARFSMLLSTGTRFVGRFTTMGDGTIATGRGCLFILVFPGGCGVATHEVSSTTVDGTREGGTIGTSSGWLLCSSTGPGAGPPMWVGVD